MTPADGVARLDLRLVPSAITAWAVTAAGILWQLTGALLVTVAAVGAAVAAAWWTTHRDAGRSAGRSAIRPVAAGIAAVAVVGAGFAVAIGLRVHDLDDHPVADRYGSIGTVVVTPSESPRSVAGSRLLFRGTLHALDDTELSGRVVVFASAGDFAELAAGQTTTFRARIGRPTRRDLTVAVLSATDEPTLGEASLVHRAAHDVRVGLADGARAVLPTDQASMLPALVLGDTSALTGQTTDEFRAAGLTHLTAVSGANVTIVCGAVLLTAAVVGPRVAVVLAALTLVAFVIVVQPEASVLRAAVMGGITLLALITHRRRQAIPALAASVIVLMIAAPQLAVDVGFALSVSATAALVVIAPVGSRRLVGRGWPKPLADAVSVAVAAQLVTAPLIAGISGRFSIVAVAANLAVAVVIPPITVLGTAAAALSTWWPAAAELLIRFTGPEMWWLLRVAGWAAGVPGSSLPVPSGLAGVVTVAVGGLSVLILWRLRWVRIGVAGAVVCLLAWTLSSHAVGAVVGPT